MSTTHISFPHQRLAYSEKIKDDFKWAKNIIDQIEMTYASQDSSTTEDYARKLANYRLYNNQIDQEDFRKECNPLGINITDFEDKIQPYNKAYNKIQVLLGEELKRPLNYKTILVNSEGIKSKQLEITKKLQVLVEEHMAQYIEALKTGDEEQSQAFLQTQLDPSELEKLKFSSYLSSKEKLANSILKYLVHQQDIKEKMNDGFKHGLLAGDEYAWVGVRNGQPVVDVLNSLGVFYEKSPEVKYVQHGTYAGYRTMMTIPDIINSFQDKLKDEDIKKLEVTYAHSSGFISKLTPDMKYYNTSPYDQYLGSKAYRNINEGSYGTADYNDYWLVTHLEWRSEKKVYFVKFVNEYGDEEKFMVNEDFVIPDYAQKVSTASHYGKKKVVYLFDQFEVEEKWIEEVWEGVKIGQDIYCGIGPKKYQHRSVDNPHTVNLGYHGIVYNNMNAKSVSLMDRMKPFFYLYLVVVHKLKKLIAKDEGQVFHMDVTTLPENMTQEQALFYIKEIGIDFYDPLRNSEHAAVHNRGKVTTSTAWSNMQHIMNYIQLMDNLDYQIGDVAGINRQREGQISNTEAVGNARQNILTSSTVTEASYFYPHYKHWNNVLTSLVEVTQACWKNKSVVKQYVLDDLSVATLELEKDDLHNSDYGVFLVDSAKEAEAFATLREWGTALLQNDKAKFSDMMNLVSATSTHELHEQIKKSERDIEAKEQQMQQAQQQMQEQQIQAETQLESAKIKAEMDKAILQAKTQLQIKQMDIESKEEVARISAASKVNKTPENRS